MSKVVGKVGEELHSKIDYLFPANIGKNGKNKEPDLNLKKFESTIAATEHGYIRILDGSSLLKIASKNNLIIKVEARPGHYITEDDPLLTIYSSEEISDGIKNKCIKTFVFGHERNPEQDILFLINEMVEIIARALSPSMNDPFTAITCMNWLQLTLQKIAKTEPPTSYRYDADDKLRIIAAPIYFGEYCDLIFCRTRPYVCKDRNATLHMLKIIYKAYSRIACEKQKSILLSHATALKNAALACQSLADNDEIQNRYHKFFG